MNEPTPRYELPDDDPGLDAYPLKDRYRDFRDLLDRIADDHGWARRTTEEHAETIAAVIQASPEYQAWENPPTREELVSEILEALR